MKSAIVALILGSVLLFLVLENRPQPAPAAPPKGDDNPSKKREDAQAQVEEPAAEIKKLQGLAPDQAAVMSHLGYHWSNLWFAIEQENWCWPTSTSPRCART